MSKFDFSTTGLPSNPHWMLAAQLCFEWLGDHMTMFGPERHLAFMENQPVGAARRIFAACDDFSPELITVLLLGPAKSTLVESVAAERLARKLFDGRVVDLIKALNDPALQADADDGMRRDIGRIVLAEGISTMNDQLIGRKRIDAHHHVRWKILAHLEEQGKALKGQDPVLDDQFADALKQSRAALEALDADAARNAGMPPRKPPGR